MLFKNPSAVDGSARNADARNSTIFLHEEGPSQASIPARKFELDPEAERSLYEEHRDLLATNNKRAAVQATRSPHEEVMITYS